MNFPKGIYIYGDRSFRGICALEKHEIRTFFALLRHKYPQLGLIAIHIRNEGKLKGGKFQAQVHKREGLVSGASDIIIPGNPSFVCELKRRDYTKSSITDEQVEYLKACKDQGAFVCIALGADSAIKAVEKWIELKKELSLQKSHDVELRL